MDDKKPTQEDIDNLSPFVIMTPSGKLFLNPGTGAVNNGTEQNSIENMKVFVQDCIAKDNTFSELGLTFNRASDADYGDGRFAFNLIWNGIEVEIQMPGWELDNVRYMSEKQNIFHFPRLYVDGSSWVWKFALMTTEKFLDIKEWRDRR